MTRIVDYLYFFRNTLSHFEGDKNQLFDLFNMALLVAYDRIPGTEKSVF